uniref:Uncharacterized protein n=1 Tax=Dendroctonus ponderosae TaxID=77166 RepID=J3JY73_DENPD|nr:unknown [Dendroctonus ponderosae]
MLPIGRTFFLSAFILGYGGVWSLYSLYSKPLCQTLSKALLMSMSRHADFPSIRVTRRTYCIVSEIMSSEINATNQSSQYSAVYVTTPNEDVAKKIAHGLVKEKLAACANIIPKVTSIYEWENKINEDSEALMMMKTRTSKVDELTAYVKANHPYQVCEVIAVPITNGNDAYLKWISDVVPEKKIN